MIAFTCDLDWAPDAVLADTLELFAHHGVLCTVFATHATPLLQRTASGIEVGLHPNFNPLLEGAGTGHASSILAELQHHYPGAIGVRSHSLTSSSRLAALFREQGLAYEANTLLPYARSLSPVRLWNGLLRIPFNWEDDVHCLYGRPFDALGLDLGRGLNILNFHPIHIYLNTETLDRYETARPHFQNPKALLDHRNRSTVPGVRDLLLSLLKEAAHLDLRPTCLGALTEGSFEESCP
ncbi:hypothetical protein [Geothrix sp. PMB-07]|uniref:polysaccharide deacetylase WbmS family protein n=1 Tax=Geothrix sp. PMB-07 TaxID=3068640 RepID=UPI002741830A|nr:hypothetical protein [Geothrix sp. PMB-07]WLT31794.1 hypothetical protein Q9293_00385 [Geothrix sp. PMB-07]